MSVNIEDADRVQFSANVKEAYQRKGPMLRSMVTLMDVINATTARVEKMGAGVAGQRGRYADVTPMDIDHTHVTATMEKWEAWEFQEKIDDKRNIIDAGGKYVMAAANALGRKSDDLVVNELNAGATQTIVDGGTSFTYNKLLQARKTLLDNNIQLRDERVKLLIGPDQEQYWLESVNEFKNRDYTAKGNIDNPGTYYDWLGMDIMVYTSLPVATSIRSCYMWVPSAIGLGLNTDIDVGIDWIPHKRTWMYGGEMYMGAKTIDALGIVEIDCQE